MAPDVLAYAQQLAVGVEQAGRVQPAGAGEARLHEPVGQPGEQFARERLGGPAGSGALCTATSSSAPLPHTPHDEVV